MPPFEVSTSLERDLSSDDVGTVGKLKIVLLLLALLAERHFASISDLIVGVKPVVLGLCGIVLNAPPGRTDF